MNADKFVKVKGSINMNIYSTVLPVVVNKKILEKSHEIINYPLLDLRVGFYIPNGIPSNSMKDNLLTYDEFSEYGLEYDVLLNSAMLNAETEFTLKSFMFTFQFATYSSGFYGAGVMACPEILEEIKRRVNGNYYLLPSSVHEVIIIPQNGCFDCGVENMLDLVKAVNGNPEVLSPYDVLSDSVYLYSDYRLTLC